MANVWTKKEVSSVIDIGKFGRLGKLLRVTSWVKCFLYNLQAAKNETEWRLGALQRGEIADAQQMWIKHSQEKLKKGWNYEDLVKKLNLKDLEGVLRCSGRLQNSDLEPEFQQPIIIPRDHQFTRLVIEECTERRNTVEFGQRLGSLGHGSGSWKVGKLLKRS